MKEKTKRSQVIKKRIVKSILWVLLTPLILLGITIAVIHLPPVQNYLIDKLTTYLTDGTGYKTEIGYANIRWFNSVVLDETTIYDNNDEVMIDINQLVVSFKPTSLIGKADIKLNEAWIKGASVNLRNADSIGLNIDEWVYNVTKLTASETSGGRGGGSFSIDKITLLESEFSIADDTVDSIAVGFDYSHFRVKDLNADLLNLKSVADTFQIDVKYLTTKDEKTGLHIKELSTFFRISQKGMAFYDLDLQAGKSRIRDSVVFRHNRASDMRYFVDSVQISAGFDESIIHSDELGLFAPGLEQYHQEVQLSGHFQGTVNSFYSDNFKMNFGQHTELQGSMDLAGLPNIDDTYIDLTLNNSTLKTEDIAQYIGPKAFQISDKLGVIKFNSKFDGFYYDFVVDNSDFQTEIGDFSLNTRLEILEDQTATYSGGLTMRDFDLGYFSEDSLFQKVDMDGSISGSGFTIEDAQFDLVATIDRVGINGYDYQRIETDGRFAQSFFNGEISVDDENFIMDAAGSVDLRDRKNLFNINGRLLRANLDTLNITDADILLATSFELDVTGIKLDSILGDIALSDTYFKYRERDILIDSLFFSSQRASQKRKVNFQSDYFDISLDGDFEFTSLLDEITNINEQYRLIFSSQLGGMKEFLTEKGRTETPFSIDYKVELPNISPIIQLFDTAVYVSPGASLIGRFTNDSQEDFNLSARADTLQFANIQFIGNEIDVNANNLRDSSQVLTLGYFFSNKQRFSNSAETEALTIEAVWDGRHIDLRHTINQNSSGNYAEIGAGIDFYNDRTELSFSESNLIALNETWHITEDNRIVFGENRIEIENLKIYNADQSINFGGQVAVLKDSSKTLGIVFNELQIENINPLTNKEYSGKINGSLKAQNLYYNPLLFGNLEIEDFRINQFPVGDIDGSLNWNDTNKRFDLDFTTLRDGKEIITLKGGFSPSLRRNQLDLDLRLNQANLNIAEPYIEDYFSQIQGTISGNVKISGPTKAPVLKGIGRLEGGALQVNYLNTTYQFDGLLRFDEDIISLPAVNFKDVNGSSADFTGAINHDSFRNFTFDLAGDINNFQVLNTNDQSLELYYGQGYATGNVEFKGETNNLAINANVTTQPNTQIFIPISESSTVEASDFITFIDRTDTSTVATETEEEVDKITIEGLKLDLDIAVTPDAYAEIIIDAKTGDIIRGRGQGQLRLQIDTQGDFNMSGDYDITQGAYNFSFYNLITKEFNIEQPSRISWYGDPYKGVMDINGSYSQVTSLAPLIQEVGLGSINEGNGNGNSRRFPTKVLLRLQGELLAPQIGFDIDFSDIQTSDFNFQTAISAFKNKIASDEQELNRQVLSLILLNRFSEEGNLNIGGQSATQNVSQLLSNQLSQLVAQLDENLEVDFDLTDLSEEAFNTFQLRIGYTFLDGRLRVTREGGISNLVDINSIAGDWTAEYLLTPEGKYKVKVYSRNNYDLANQALSQNATSNTTGASITQTTSFNTLREFFTGVNQKRKNKRQAKAQKSTTNPNGSN